jgi:plasmid stability protein
MLPCGEVRGQAAWPFRRGSLPRRIANGAWRSLTGLGKSESIEANEINKINEDRVAGNLHVRNLEDELIAKLKRRAARHGRSTEAEHREILRQALAGETEPDFDTLAAELRKLTKRRKQTPSEILLREGRTER